MASSRLAGLCIVPAPIPSDRRLLPQGSPPPGDSLATR